MCEQCGGGAIRGYHLCAWCAWDNYAEDCEEAWEEAAVPLIVDEPHPLDRYVEMAEALGY